MKVKCEFKDGLTEAKLAKISQKVAKSRLDGVKGQTGWDERSNWIG